MAKEKETKQAEEAEIVKAMMSEPVKEAELTPEQIQARYPAAYKEIIERAAGKKNLGAGFVIDWDDPFAEAILREYNRVYKTVERLPIVLTASGCNTPLLLGSYILRAKGGCRYDLAAKAEAELDKIAAGKGTIAEAAKKMLEGKKKK